MIRNVRRPVSSRPLVKPAAVLVAAGMGFLAYAVPASAADEKAADAKKADAPVTYVKDIQPLLKELCVRCHGAPQAAGRGPGGAPGQRPPGGPGGRPGPGGPGGGPRGPAAGLRLDSKPAILKGGKHGKAVVPGKSEESLLYQVLKGPAHSGDDEIAAMPKSRPGQEFTPLPDEEIELIGRWIDQGAK